MSIPIRVGLHEAAGAVGFAYTIDTSALPPSAQGLTAVMCEVNEYMMGQQGMNIGGISLLFNKVLISYATAQVGFQPKV